MAMSGKKTGAIGFIPILVIDFISLIFGVYLSLTLASTSSSVVVVNHNTLVQGNSPGSYGTYGNQSEIISTSGPQMFGLSPLPAGLVGNVPQIEVSYDNMPFSGEQGSVLLDRDRDHEPEHCDRRADVLHCCATYGFNWSPDHRRLPQRHRFVPVL